MTLAALYALLLAVLAGPLGPLLGATLAHTGPVVQVAAPFEGGNMLAAQGQVHCEWSGVAGEQAEASMWLWEWLLWWPPEWRDPLVVHEYLHALDCLDDGLLNGSPLPFPPVTDDPAHEFVNWALANPAQAIELAGFSP